MAPAAGTAIHTLAKNLSRIEHSWVRVAAIVVSEMIDRLSPNIAPPMTVPTASGRSSPVASPRPTATGTIAATVPFDVPIAVEMSAEMRNSPGSSIQPGMSAMPALTVASTAPIASITLENAPASRKTMHIVMMVRSPMPCRNAWMRSVSGPRPIHRARPMAGRIATGARSW